MFVSHIATVNKPPIHSKDDILIVTLSCMKTLSVLNVSVLLADKLSTEKHFETLG